MDKVVILVVEDEFLIVINAIQILEDAGYIVLEATDADDAITILESRPDIRAVFTDINMTGSMDGLQLAHVIEGRWPSIHVLLTSGQRAITQADLPPRGRFIPKPYEGARVLAILDELFAAA
jgi:DNA-binding NtrC family response regulator